MHNTPLRKIHAGRKHKALSTKHSTLVVVGFIAPFLLTVFVLVAVVVQNASHLGVERVTSRLEIGVADLSPRGEQGGEYLPASCVLGPGIPGGHEVCAPTAWWSPASITIPIGSTASYSFNSTSASYCNQAVTGLGAGVGDYIGGSPSGAYTNAGPYTISGVQTRTITCFDSDNINSASAVLNITVLPEVRLETTTAGAGYPWAKISQFGAPDTHVNLFDSTTITWSSTGDCTASGSPYPGWAGAKPASGSFPAPNLNRVSTSQAFSYKTFRLSCTRNLTTDTRNFQIIYDNDFTSSCFTAGTMVTLADGSAKDIAEILKGDKVRGIGGSVNTVVGVETPRLGERLLYAINGGKSFVTAEHPFMTTVGWKSVDPELTKKESAKLEVGTLSVGDTLVTSNGNVFIESLTPTRGDPAQTLYNLLLDGDHTYYADGFLVHNKIAM